MSPIPAMSYDLLWGERVIRSVANLTREDGLQFLSLACTARLQVTVEPMALTEANVALDRLRKGQLTGAAVLVP
jgi:propanol-preferring alcohol dehydrogenase